MPEIRTGCRYHTQDLANSCGAAVAMMILDHQGQPASGFSQATAHHDLTRAGTTIGTLPQDLVRFLNTKLGGTIYVLLQSMDAPVLINLVRDSLSRPNPLPIAVPFGQSAHWVVVEGIKIKAGPGQDVLGAWIHSPEHWGLNNPPPHHADRCGSGGNHGVAVDYRPLNKWKKGVGQPSSTYRFTCVLAAPLPALPTTVAGPPPPPKPRPFNVSTILDELKANELEDQLGPLSELGMGQPLLVHALDNDEGDYWLMPLQREGQRIVALSCFDAQGSWLRAVGFPFPTLQRLRPTDQEVVTALMELGSLGSFVPTREWWHQRLLEARFVWKLCVESFTPYWPFFEVPLAGVLPEYEVVYVGFNLRVTFQLTEPVEGG